MEQKIHHRGVVAAVEDGLVRVRIVQSSACAGCAAKKLCSSAESKEKMVEVRVADAAVAARYGVGQEVEVVARVADSRVAALLAYVVPLVLVVGVLLTLLCVTSDETLAALAALLVLVPYYVVLYACRMRLQRRFCFEIETN